MPRQRRVVLDTSAVSPAFFPDESRVVNRRSRRLLAAAETGEIVAFAPDVLQAEFLKRAVRRLSEMARRGADRDSSRADAEGQWYAFFASRIIYTPAEELAAIAWDMASAHAVAAPDSWFAACARLHDAELWLSHRHTDRAGEHAQVYGVDVRYLSEEAL